MSPIIKQGSESSNNMKSNSSNNRYSIKEIKLNDSLEGPNDISASKSMTVPFYYIS